MLQNVKIVKVKTGESPPLQKGEMYFDRKTKTMYLGVGDVDTDPKEREVNENG